MTHSPISREPLPWKLFRVCFRHFDNIPFCGFQNLASVFFLFVGCVWRLDCSVSRRQTPTFFFPHLLFPPCCLTSFPLDPPPPPTYSPLVFSLAFSTSLILPQIDVEIIPPSKGPPSLFPEGLISFQSIEIFRIGKQPLVDNSPISLLAHPWISTNPGRSCLLSALALEWFSLSHAPASLSVRPPDDFSYLNTRRQIACFLWPLPPSGNNEFAVCFFPYPHVPPPLVSIGFCCNLLLCSFRFWPSPPRTRSLSVV